MIFSFRVGYAQNYSRSPPAQKNQTSFPVAYQKSRMTRPPQLPSPLVFDSQPADRFAELIPWIMRNLHEDLSVNTLARRACMSPSHFNRAFKSVFGSAPGEFVETLRINEAKRRLSVPKRTLETIAASVGFSDAQTFRRAFERRLGAKARSYLNTVNFNLKL
jgi:transcriptional regulator GlxA family with amidase domain